LGASTLGSTLGSSLLTSGFISDAPGSGSCGTGDGMTGGAGEAGPSFELECSSDFGFSSCLGSMGSQPIRERVTVARSEPLRKENIFKATLPKKRGTTTVDPAKPIHGSEL